jgi:hypothetical protein
LLKILLKFSEKACHQQFQFHRTVAKALTKRAVSHEVSVLGDGEAGGVFGIGRKFQGFSATASVRHLTADPKVSIGPRR